MTEQEFFDQHTMDTGFISDAMLKVGCECKVIDDLTIYSEIGNEHGHYKARVVTFKFKIPSEFKKILKPFVTLELKQHKGEIESYITRERTRSTKAEAAKDFEEMVHVHTKQQKTLKKWYVHTLDSKTP